MKMYDYLRSSAAYRVRIACALKGLEPERVSIDLRTAAHKDAAYRAEVPSGLVPGWVDNDGWHLSQSIAIIRYLDRIYPEPMLIPTAPRAEARALELALAIACDIHPINNLRVLQYLEREIGISTTQRDAWYAHWIQEAYRGLEVQVAANGGPYCLGAELSIVDVCLAPQMVNARRFKVDVSAFPTLVAIDNRLRVLPAFAANAAPDT